MKQWVHDLYRLILVEKAPAEELRSYITNGSDPWVEWIEESYYPRGMDEFRYGDIDRLVRHELHYAMKEK